LDGLQGIHTWPLLRLLSNSISTARAAYGYALAVLFLIFLVARRLIHSPFGLALRGIRENNRAHAGHRRADRMPISAPSTPSPPSSPALLARCWRRRPRPYRSSRSASSAQPTCWSC
jgi:hypothetical protein